MPDAALAAALGADVVAQIPLHGGDIADVSLIDLADGRRLVAKRPRAGQPDTTALEARQLGYLAEHSALPVPTVIHHSPGLLVMTYIAHAGGHLSRAEADLAAHLAALHGVVAPDYGLAFDTVLATAPQRNDGAGGLSWPDFWATRRLLPMAHWAHARGGIDAGDVALVDRLAASMADHLPAAPPASLLHGDLWPGNILLDGARVAGFIDPAISHGHAETDLAFLALFASPSANFYAAYANAGGVHVDPEFYTVRTPLYQLWWLLYHAGAFGGSYGGSCRLILRRFV